MNRKKMLMSLAMVILAISGAVAQNKPNNNASDATIARPKLVVGIIVDQMRWDYLYRFYNVYEPNGGFKRLLNQGFSCDNTLMPYLPTVTAVGHTCVYTGSVPTIAGITGNNWYDNNTHKTVYCTDDASVSTVGSTTKAAGEMSPRNLWVTTITDELRLATNFKSKTIGLSIKDRGAILPAGHAANAAYWYDYQTGNFISSTYYMNQLPEWLTAFNNKKWVDTYYEKNWSPLLPKATYEALCDADVNDYESQPFGKDQKGFPYNLEKFKGKDYSKIASTPYANELLENLAETTIANEQLGKGNATDFLAVSFSSTDYIGHAFGPNSWEVLDVYARLDRTLGKFFDYLDKTIGKNQYTVFLTADHAGAQIPEFLAKHNIPGGRADDPDIKRSLNQYLAEQFHQPNLINAVWEFDVYLNHNLIDSLQLNQAAIEKSIAQYLQKDDRVLTVVNKAKAATASLPVNIREMIVNGYTPKRSGDLQIIMKSGVMDAGKTGMSHGVAYTYDTHIPLLFYGWGIQKGHLNRTTYMTDISATIAALLKIQMPSGCIGQPITEAYRNN
ncbi:alkaline phosphatase PafA [Hydrotalea sandarakina]|jgi:predicted AlkP superfamily pyrophosphatase or phosphodiesterase|uniref:Type I phosphodiesterase/nucleotide pyrophosphatase n=1 Tax=Hydrotalea sandarakina TaxID=1004304 RepID=A0A2W7RS42_9BACT|nr:alkaline phosphatase PafA [Hydrotalea sandarakina]PZX63578.1 type I phosphodiesterase/nucleotide pyrophosphatase [Hydrotalea sandarakina]